MHAALVVFASLVSHATPAPATTPDLSSLPVQLVLEGCNNASAQRAAEIRLMPSDAPETRAAVDALLRAPDGAVCLLETDVLVRLQRGRTASDVVAKALAFALESDFAHVARRADEVLGDIGTSDPAGFGKLVRRIEVLRKGQLAGR